MRGGGGEHIPPIVIGLNVTWIEIGRGDVEGRRRLSEERRLAVERRQLSVTAGGHDAGLNICWVQRLVQYTGGGGYNKVLGYISY